MSFDDYYYEAYLKGRLARKAKRRLNLVIWILVSIYAYCIIIKVIEYSLK